MTEYPPPRTYASTPRIKMTNALSKPEAEKPIVMGKYHDSCCYWNAEENMKTAFKHLNLKRVCGSVGFNGWWEYGGKRHTLRNFMRNPSDSHCWLEDDAGNVYDYCQPSWAYYCHMNGVKPDIPLGVEFRGLSKKELKEMNLEYVAAPEDAQKALLAWANEPRSDVMKALVASPWVPREVAQPRAWVRC